MKEAVRAGDWSKTCLRILREGVTHRRDLAVAARLIDEGYGVGQVVRSKESGAETVERVLWEHATIRGELLVEEIERDSARIRRRQMLYRLALAIISGLIGLSLGIGLARGAL